MSKKKKKSFPTAPLVSAALVVFIGGINSTGAKGMQLGHDGYECIVPKMPSNNVTALCAKFLPHCMTNVGSYVDQLSDICLSCTKRVPDIVVGSSQGGAVAMSLVQNEWKGARLVLIAPAWKTFGIKPVVPSSTIVLHGTKDWLVSPSHSEQLCKKNKCTLIKVNDNHSLEYSYNEILKAVDAQSVATGKHKTQDVINKEWQEYKDACERYLAVNCTKTSVPNNFSFLESSDGKLW